MNIKNRTAQPEQHSTFVEALVWLMLSLIGIAGFWLASGWPMGQVGRPGPGAFAAIVLALLTALALVRLVVCCRGHNLRIRPPWIPADHSTLALLAAPAVFAVMIEPAGFIVSSLISAALGAMAAGERLARAALIAFVLTLSVFVLFRFGLSVPLDWRGSWMR